jgi:hypothetical protein
LLGIKLTRLEARPKATPGVPRSPHPSGEICTSPADLGIVGDELTWVHPLPALRRTCVLAGLCDQLTTTRTVYPGTDLTLVYTSKTADPQGPAHARRAAARLRTTPPGVTYLNSEPFVVFTKFPRRCVVVCDVDVSIPSGGLWADRALKSPWSMPVHTRMKNGDKEWSLITTV